MRGVFCNFFGNVGISNPFAEYEASLEYRLCCAKRAKQSEARKAKLKYLKL